MRFGSAIVALALGCSATHPSGGGYVVTADSPCHTLLLAQCKCCGSGEPFCTGEVEALVSSGKAVSNEPPAACQKTLDSLPGDALCKTFDDAAKLEAACQEFPPQPDAGSDVTGD